MKARDRYDLIAIGDQSGALLSAVLAARAGFSVLIVPQSLGDSARTVPVSGGEQVFDQEPNAIGGAWAQDKFRAPVEDLLKRAGMLEGEWEALQSQRRGLELIMDSARVRLGNGYREFVAEMKREWGGESKDWSSVQSLLKTTEDLCLQHWGRAAHRLSVRKSPEEKKKSDAEYSERQWRRSLQRTVREKRKELNSLTTSRSLQETLEALASFGSETRSDLPEIYQFLALLGMEAPFRGGMTAWRAQLLRLAKRLGAEVAPKGDFKHLWVSRGRFQGVQLGAKSAVIEGRCGVLGIPLELARQKLVQSGIGNWRSLKEPLEPSGWRFSIAMTVRKEVLPEGLPARLVIAEKDSPALEVEIAAPADYGVNDPEYQVLFLRTVLPFDSETLRPEYQRMMAARMVRKITETFPYLEYHVVHLYPDFRISAGQRRKLGIVTSQEPLNEDANELLAVYGGYERLEQIPDQLRVFRGRGRGVHSGVGHLFLVGQEAYPELGAWGCAWAAIESTQWLASKSGLSSILQGEKKEEV